MAKEFLDGLKVPRHVKDTLPGRMAGLVHPLAGGDALGDDSRRSAYLGNGVTLIKVPVAPGKNTLPPYPG